MTKAEIIKPDECSSLICYPPHDYCPDCSHAGYFGEGSDIKGKLWRWSFNPMFGPLFLRKDGEPVERQPMRENHPAWGPFEKWAKERDN